MDNFKYKKFWKIFGLIIAFLTILLMGRVYFIQDSLPWKRLILECLLSVFPALFFVVLYSLLTKQAKTRGGDVKKKDEPALYYFMTLFWIAALLLDIIFIFMIKQDVY
ncbi:MAG: hypothetical protein GY705_18340 [Bacteroidetes bacterium]|nr:hypothetical protein [Bacteroidota bacterium]